MTEAVVWLVLWALFTFVGPGVVYFIGLVIGFLVSLAADDEGWTVVLGIFLGWLGGVAWFIFAAIQTVLQIISVVQLASG